MRIKAKIEHAVQVRERGYGHGLGKWEVFREFDTAEEAEDYAGSDRDMRVVSRTTVTITEDWEEGTLP